MFTWVTQLYNFDLVVSDVFFFWINANVPSVAIPSAYFIITEPDRETISTSFSTSASTSRPTSETSAPASDPENNTTATDSGPSIPSQNPALSEPDSSKSINDTALGVGLGIGVPVLGALAVLIWIQVHKAKGARTDASLRDAQKITLRRPRLPPVEVSGEGYRELAA
ncbi:hypothetical protein BDV06DRAFT_226379 [Aspergillus oleicola]